MNQIWSLATPGDWQQGLRLLLHTAHRRLLDVVTFSSAISACEKAAEWQKALELLRYMGEVEAWGQVGRNNFKGKQLHRKATCQWKKKHLKMIEDVSPIRKGDFPVMCWCVCLLEGMSDGFLHEIVGHYSIFLVLTGLQVVIEIWDQFWFVPDLIGTSGYQKNEWQLSWEFTKQKIRKFPEGAAQCDYLQCSNQRMWLGGGNLESFNGHKLEKDGFLWRVFSS